MTTELSMPVVSHNPLPEIDYMIPLSFLPTSCSILSTDNDWKNSSEGFLNLGLNAQTNFQG